MWSRLIEHLYLRNVWQDVLLRWTLQLHRNEIGLRVGLDYGEEVDRLIKNSSQDKDI